MLRFLADENFNNHAILGLRGRDPRIDIVRVQDVGLSGQEDAAILAWAAKGGRVVITHDVSTLSRLAYERDDDLLASAAKLGCVCSPIVELFRISIAP